MLNKYTVIYSEYGKDKHMDCFISNTERLKKALNYWLGAYDFEWCTAPTIYRIVNNKGENVLENYIKRFNDLSSKISKKALPEMDYQNMSWAKPCTEENDHLGGIA